MANTAHRAAVRTGVGVTLILMRPPLLPTDPLPHATRLGQTYTGWECESCGVVDASEVVADGNTAWHADWNDCNGTCHPVELLAHDPRAMANEGILKLHALAFEVLRLREALAQIAETPATPIQYRRWAQKALRGQTLGSAKPV